MKLGWKTFPAIEINTDENKQELDVNKTKHPTWAGCSKQAEKEEDGEKGWLRQATTAAWDQTKTTHPARGPSPTEGQRSTYTGVSLVGEKPALITRVTGSSSAGGS